eukprot:TRINITY_DN12427_c0_g1_i10.p2 TRINITY_DN12427_c0_g1~~TRINITY_DN12427_c0_g1_i10.p2  ORF type:complete len:113 (+),score=14.72 TRINITY_DN12427_c0_g1_i10:41-379(+)
MIVIEVVRARHGGARMCLISNFDMGYSSGKLLVSRQKAISTCPCLLSNVPLLCRYKTHTLDVDLDGIDYDYSYTVGFFVVASGTVSALLALISSFCIKTHDEYETLEGYTFA